MNDMNLLLFATGTSEPSVRIEKVIRTLVPKSQIEIYHTRKSLYKRLVEPTYDIAIVVLLVTTKEELSELLSARHFLNDIRIILVLPDTDNETVTLGHKLYPRFVSYVDSDFEDVAAVLNKMLATTYPKHLRTNTSFEAKC